jgi:regulator of sigma E protease
MNLVTALVLFTIVALLGMPQLVDNQFSLKQSPPPPVNQQYAGTSTEKVPVDQHLVSSKVVITYVEPGSPADKAGLKSQDEILALRKAGYSPVPISSEDKLPEVTKNFAGETVDVYYMRGGIEKVGHTTLLSQKAVEDSRKTDNPKGYLGVIPTDFTMYRSTWSAPVVAVGLSAQLTGLTFQGLGHALGGLGSWAAGLVTGNDTARHNGSTQASADVAGPVGIFEILKGSSAMGYQFMLFVIAYISLTLAIMNILPIPALDGGRLWLMLFSRAIKKPISAKREEMINATGFLILISLIVLITIVDVKRFL